MHIPPDKVNSINSQDLLIEFLQSELGWTIPENTNFEELTYDWDPAKDLNIKKEDLRGSQISQFRPLTGSQPWGIFIIKLNKPRFYVTELRRIIRALAPSKRGHKDFPTWNPGHLLFICTHDWKDYTFAHFEGEKPERAKLSTFSWEY